MDHLPDRVTLVEVHATLHADDRHVVDVAEAEVARMPDHLRRRDVGDLRVGDLLDATERVRERAEPASEDDAHARRDAGARAHGLHGLLEALDDALMLAHEGEKGITVGAPSGTSTAAKSSAASREPFCRSESAVPRFSDVCTMHNGRWACPRESRSRSASDCCPRVSSIESKRLLLREELLAALGDFLREELLAALGEQLWSGRSAATIACPVTEPRSAAPRPAWRATFLADLCFRGRALLLCRSLRRSRPHRVDGSPLLSGLLGAKGEPVPKCT